jgi:hypothetical protein
LHTPYFVVPMMTSAISVPMTIGTHVRPEGHTGASTLQYFKHPFAPKHPYVAAQSPLSVQVEPCVPVPPSAHAVKIRCCPACSRPKRQYVPVVQPVFVEGSQLSVQSFTPGIVLPLPSFNVRMQRPPGAVHCESAEQYLPQVSVVAEVARQMPPGAQSVVPQSPPIGAVPAVTHKRAPVPSIVQASPDGQPH